MPGILLLVTAGPALPTLSPADVSGWELEEGRAKGVVEEGKLGWLGGLDVLLDVTEEEEEDDEEEDDEDEEEEEDSLPCGCCWTALLKLPRRVLPPETDAVPPTTAAMETRDEVEEEEKPEEEEDEEEKEDRGLLLFTGDWKQRKKAAYHETWEISVVNGQGGKTASRPHLADFAVSRSASLFLLFRDLLNKHKQFINSQ